jgi:hypothetical protein
MEKMKPRLKLSFSPDEREGIIKSSMGLTLDEIDNVFARSLVKHRTSPISLQDTCIHDSLAHM